MSKMKEKRKKELAMKVVKYHLKWKGIRLNLGLKREIMSHAKLMDIDPKEALQFTEIIIRDLVNEIFASSK